MVKDTFNKHVFMVCVGPPLPLCPSYLFRFNFWHVFVICNDGLCDFRGSVGNSFTSMKERTLIVIMTG